VARVNSRKRGSQIAPMKCLHDRRHPRPSIATDQTAGGFERSQMALRVETVAALAP